jgi:hypothetical protein
MKARGAGVTGGEPLLALEKTCHYIHLLKSGFGKDFYIHLYTCGDGATEEAMKKLEDAGLDEIRFHLLEGFEKALPALDTCLRAGFEVPCIPGDWKRLKALTDFAAEHGFFINLNEFEFSDSNFEALRARGFSHPEETYAVPGSRELAMRVLRYAEKKGVDAHFCPLFVKYSVQLTNRLKRRAKTIKKPWERVDENGMLVRGVIECSAGKARKLGVHYNKEKKRGETSVKKALGLARKGLKAWREVEYPSSNPWVFGRDPLE